MQYSQIIALIIAISIITSAPYKVQPLLPPYMAALFIVLKAIIGYSIILFFERRRAGAKAAASPDISIWFANALLFIDMWGLNIKWHIARFLSIINCPLSLETPFGLTGLLIYFFYVSLGWTAVWNGSLRIKDHFDGLREFIIERLRLLCPASIPYILSLLLADIMGYFSFSYSDWFFLIFLVAALILLLPVLTYRIWGCIPMPSSPLRDAIEGFLSSNGVGVKEILLWPSKGLGMCTAGVLGFMPYFRYLLLTPCLISYLTYPEIMAVLSHEAEHIKRRHMLWYLIIIFAYIFVFYRVVELLTLLALSNRAIFNIIFISQEDPIYLSLIISAPAIIGFVLYFRFIIGYFMRNFEREADVSVFKHNISPEFMISALEKVAYLAGGIRERPNWHHYSVKERVEFIERAWKDPSLLLTFKRGLRRKKLLLIGSFLTLGLLTSIIPQSSWEAQIKDNILYFFIDNYVERDKAIDKADIYLSIGNYFLEKGEFKEAEHCLKMALRIDPNNPDALNNLAWLYVTSKDRAFYRPKDALSLILRALELKREHFILDTAAEAYWANGDYKKAVEYAILALKMARDKGVANIGYYKRQLRRFKDALK